jgi:hypothetical protein
MPVNSLKNLCIHLIAINNASLQINILPKELQNVINNTIKKYNDDILNKINLDKLILFKSGSDESDLYESYLYESDSDEYKSDLDKFGNKYNICDNNSKNVNKYEHINDIGNNKKQLVSYLKKNYY